MADSMSYLGLTKRLGLRKKLGLGGANLNAGVGGVAPFGYGFVQDELGAYANDETGARVIAQPALQYSLIKDAAAARGIKFGAAVRASDVASQPAYGTLMGQQCSLLVPEISFQPDNIQHVQGVFTWTGVDAFTSLAAYLNLPYRFPAGMIYPAHDMAWVSTTDPGTHIIIPTLDGGGNPNLNAGNWQASIDAHFEAIKAHGIEPTTINISNELIDPLQGDGWRRHPWYTAAGPWWLLYAFQKAHSLWPNTPLGLGQDLTEQLGSGDSYYPALAAAFLTNLQWLISNGAPITYVDLQGHLQFKLGYDPLAHRTFLQAVQALGLKIVVGEFDIRTGNTGAYIPANYSDQYYDRTVAFMASQYLDTILPFVWREFVVWGLGDAYQAWNAGERPLLYDASLMQKPGYYAAVLENMSWR